MNIIKDSTINKTVGRNGQTIHTIVLHSTYGSYLGSVAWLKNPTAKVSSHYIISETGEIRQLVDEKDTAWANGNLQSNRESIAIETTDNKKKDITPKAKEALIWLVADIKKRHNIKDIKYHREIVATACPFLNIDKAWFATLDPLAECLAQHQPLVDEVTKLKTKLAQQKLDFDATEKRLKDEKDNIVKEKDKEINKLNEKANKFQRERDKAVEVSKTCEKLVGGLEKTIGRVQGESDKKDLTISDLVARAEVSIEKAKSPLLARIQTFILDIDKAIK